MPTHAADLNHGQLRVSIREQKLLREHTYTHAAEGIVEHKTKGDQYIVSAHGSASEMSS
jgi:hypothetical protein